MMSGRSTERGTRLSRRLALQQRVDAKPVAVHQQIRRETQAQVLFNCLSYRCQALYVDSCFLHTRFWGALFAYSSLLVF